MNSSLTIKFFTCELESSKYPGFVTVDYEPKAVIDLIRQEAKSKGWSGIEGIKEYWKVEYSATLRTGSKLNWTSITFKDQETFDKFTILVTTNFLMNG